MSYKDLRGWITEVERMGELRLVRGADWNLEIGTIAEWVHKEKNGPAILFDEVKDHPKGFRLLINSMGATKRLALTLGVPSDLSAMGLVEAIKNKLKGVALIPPRFVDKGAIFENVYQGEDVNVLAFPTPKWNELDGGRYIGTGGVDITKDPDEGWVNLGTYRVMIHDRKTVAFYISPGKHGRIHREKYFSRGEPCKVAVCLGQDPSILLAGSMEVPYGVPEYDFIGGMKGRPVEVVKGPYTGLPIPADAEIVIEGESYPGETKMEGPFGEFTGYYASSARPEPFIKVKTVLYRNDPILLCSPPGKPPYENAFYRSFLKSANIWNDLEKAGVPDVRGVWVPPAGGAMSLIFLSIKQRYPGHAKQAALIAAQCGAGAYMGRYVIVMDDDIDITDMDEVFWALATRSDPDKSIDIVRRCWSTPLDPMIPSGAPSLNSRAIIEACRPFEWIDSFPPVVEAKKQYLNEVKQKWESSLFPGRCT
ncbi:MAG: UbiD family decarboxylase [Pseudomonadota bacterium]